MRQNKIGISLDGSILLIEDVNLQNVSFRDWTLIKKDSIADNPSYEKNIDKLREYNFKNLSCDESLVYEDIIKRLKYIIDAILDLPSNINEDTPSCFINKYLVEKNYYNISLYQCKSFNRYEMLRIWSNNISKETIITSEPHWESSECEEWEPLPKETYELVEFLITSSLSFLYDSLLTIYKNK